jgi:tripartite-type tricarboxylate transporter receptor subunit TctC
MPDAVKAKLENVFKAVMADQKLRERLANLDITPDFTPGTTLRARLETEIRSWSKFVDDKGIKPE